MATLTIPERRPNTWERACLVVFLVAIAAGLSALPKPDRETIPDPRRTMPDDQNAYAALIDAMDGFVKPPNEWTDYPHPYPSSRPEYLAFVEANGARLDRIDEALTQPELGPPDGPLAGPIRYAPLRGMAVLKIQRGYRRLELGGTAGALRDFLDVYSVGRRLANSGGALASLTNAIVFVQQ